MPSSGLIVLASRLSKVDLPAPFCPLMVTISEVWALKLTRLRANLVPYHLQTALALMVVVGCSGLNFKNVLLVLNEWDIFNEAAFNEPVDDQVESEDGDEDGGEDVDIREYFEEAAGEGGFKDGDAEGQDRNDEGHTESVSHEGEDDAVDAVGVEGVEHYGDEQWQGAAEGSEGVGDAEQEVALEVDLLG